ncbi:MAG: hypothetical protein H6R01_1657 [Burkholderiaceae bacterium]|nr:hypothetical protein [Burkholderiaceae bacterium]
MICCLRSADNNSIGAGRENMATEAQSNLDGLQAEPHPNSGRRLRVWMRIALIAFNVFAIAAFISSMHESYGQDVKEAEIQSQNLSLAMDLAFTNEFDKIDLSLKTIIGILNSSGGVGAEARRTVEEQFRIHKNTLADSNHTIITDASGKSVLALGAGGESGVNIGDRDYFIELKSGRKQGLIVSPPLVSRITGETALVFARSYFDHAGKFAGVIAVHLPVSYFEKVLGGFDVGNRGALAIRSNDFELIARISPGNEKNSAEIGEKNVSLSFAKLVQEGKQRATYHALVPFDHVERIFSYRLLSIVPVYVFAGISTQDYLSEWHRAFWVDLFFLLGLLTVANASVILLYRQWHRQRLYGEALKNSHSQLAASLKQVLEQDVALIAAQDAGGLGTYKLDIPTRTFIISAHMKIILGIDDSYPNTTEGCRQLVHPDDRDAVALYFWEDVIGKGESFDWECRVVRPCDGEVIWVHGLGKLEFDPEGRPLRMNGTVQDISKRKASESRLYLSQQVFQSALEGILVTDTAGTIVEVNPAFTQITGYSYDEAVGQNPRILGAGLHDETFYRQLWQSITQKGVWEGEFTNRRKDGRVYIQKSRISAIRRGGVLNGYAALISDVTELKESQQQIEHLAYYDKLTGLANRALLADRIQQAISHDKGLLAVCYIDVDDFKPVNDEWGTDIGDRVLIEVAHRLQNVVRPGDMVARMGGDEFVVLLTARTSQQDIDAVTDRILACHAEPYLIKQFRWTLTMSVGVTIYPNDSVNDADTLIRHADQAMYEAKRNGKNRLHYYDLENDLRIREFQRQYADIVDALSSKQFRLHYQPKIDMRTGTVVGAEALIRWEHPEQGLLQPGQFLPVIESTELTLPVGEWVLHEVMQQKQRWRGSGVDMPVSVNIFALHLQRSDFVERLESILRLYPDINPEGLELEILETTSMEDLDEISVRINACKRLGVRFSLDDFGTGYSSLTYFRQLPVDLVKIDRSFVIDMLDDENDQALVDSIVGMARTLKRQVVAEGVETLEHGISLLKCGCDFAQGYGIARPMPPDKFLDWLSQWRMPDAWAKYGTTKSETQQAVS